jgi:hypothetical protein
MSRLLDAFSKRNLPQIVPGSTKEMFGASANDEFSDLSFALLQASKSTAERSNAQRQMVQDIATMERQIQSSARRCAGNSQKTAEQTESVARDTERGHELMEATATAMRDMSKTAKESASLMREFVQRMTEINRVVETVRDIARQTNLLALNAAVEAAHAGSHGDGFNVIAQEIRALADRAKESTTEIATSIGSMGATALSAERSMLRGEEAADTSIRRNLEVQNSLQSIRNSMYQVQTMSAEVADASNRQTASLDRLSGQLNEIDCMALASTFEADAAAEMSMRLVGSANRLRRSGSGRIGSLARGALHSSSDSDNLVRQISNSRPRVGNALEQLRAECLRAGAPRVNGTIEIGKRAIPHLHFGTTSACGADALVDRVNQRTGCVATLFVRDGSDFVRTATNIKRADGSRATGTILNPKGAAMAQLTRKLTHEGAVYILGKPFVAAYDPVLSASGDVIGALYVGLPLDQ